MIPRLGSEALVAAAVESAKDLTRRWAAAAVAAAATAAQAEVAQLDKTFRVLDIGTGSGALVLAFLCEMNEWLSKVVRSDGNLVDSGPAETELAAFAACGGTTSAIAWRGV